MIAPLPLRTEVRVSRPTCYRCCKPRVACICASIVRVANRTGVTILQHPRERFHAIGTARIAQLGLENVRIESCAPWAVGAASPVLPAGAALLYPGVGSRDLAVLSPQEQPRHLVVLDGTWFHARKIFAAHCWLHDLPMVCVTPREPSRYRIRREPKAGYIATLEAVVMALRILEPGTPGFEGLIDAFVAMIDRQAVYSDRRRAAVHASRVARTRDL